MTLEIKRSYLEIKSLDELKDSSKPSENYCMELIEEPDFQLNKFFYKNVGKKYRWTDRLIWTCLLYTSPSPRDLSTSRMPSSA